MKTLLYLTPMDHGRAFSLEDFEKADAIEGYRYELIDGRLDVSPIPDMPHDSLQKWLVRLLEGYARQHPEVINEVRAPARVFVPERRASTAPEPDVAAYHDFPHDLPLAQQSWRDFSPMLVIEILSEDNAEKDLDRNLNLYLAVPTIREYWILDPRANPDEPSLTVHRRRGPRWQRAIEVPFRGTYTTRMLPGFSLLVDPRN